MEKISDQKFLEVLVIVVLVVILAANTYFGIKYFSFKVELEKLMEKVNHNEKIINFQNLFVDKVLKAEAEVSYEDRLKLENAVVNTQDQEVINTWHIFLASTTEEEAQQEVLNLLTLFSKKIY